MTNTVKRFCLFSVLCLFLSCGTKDSKQDQNEAKTSTTTTAETKADKKAETKERTAPTPKASAALTKEEIPQNLEEQIAAIVAEFKNIESNLPSYERRILQIQGGEWVPTELTGYYQGNVPVKILSEEAQGHQSKMTSYYFKEEKLFFVYEAISEEASLRGPYTGREFRTYIHDGKAIRILQKEATFKNLSNFDLTNVKNTDITSEMKDKPNWVPDYLTLIGKFRLRMEPDQ